MSGGPSRQLRRTLSRRADRLVASIIGAPLPDDLDVRRHVGLLHGHAPLLVASRDAVRVALGHAGFNEVLDELEGRPQPGGKLPIVVCLDEGYATVAYLPVVRLVPGGSA
jgi:hypothetical protein